jgi:hypothetical protein
MPQQEALQVLAGLARHAHCRGPRPDQIAHRLMRGIRNPDRRQLTGPVQLRQHHSIAAIRLYPVTRLHRDQGWCHHNALMSHLDELTMKATAARPRLIAEMQPRSASLSTNLRM